MKNAIERVMEMKALASHYGEKISEIREGMVKDHPLDYTKDAPVPDWAIDIMKDKRIGYRTRIKIIMTHQFDITDCNPSMRFVTPSEARNAPPKPPPKKILDFRAKKAKEAEEFLNTQTQKGSKVI